MPLDPRIVLGVESPPAPNPLQALSAVAQLQAVRENAELRREQVEIRRQAAEAARAKARQQEQIDVAWQEAVSIDPVTGQTKVDRAKLKSQLPGHLWPSVDKELDLDETRVLDLQTKRNDLTKSQRALATSMADTIAASNFHPAIIATALKRAHAEQVIDDDQFSQLSQADPETFKTLIEGLRTHTAEKPQLVERVLPTGETVKEWVVPKVGEQYLQAPTAAKGVTIGSFEDYVARYAQAKGKPITALTPADIEDARKRYQQADDRPINIHTPREVTPTAALNMTRQLRNDFTKETKAATTIEAQLANMKSSLAAVKSGSAPAGSQGVLVTFQKILDPTSVVRESEYARSASGLSLLGRLEGIWMKIAQGGAGVSPRDLEQFVGLADQFAQNQRRSAAETKAQIDGIAREYGLKPELITHEIGEILTGRGATPPPATGGAPGVMSYEDYQKKKKPGG